MELDRRTFLKCLAGAAVVAAVAPSALATGNPVAEAKRPCEAEIDVGNGVVYLHGTHFVPGDMVTITSTSNPRDQGVYRVEAVHVNDDRVTLAIVHRGEEVTMRRDEVAPFINREINGRDGVIDAVYPNRAERRGRRQPDGGGYTWPQPQRRHR